MSAWRAAGLTYIDYSSIAARLLRRALKPEFRKAAEKRDEVSVRITYWKDGKANREYPMYLLYCYSTLPCA
ncbi:atp synthase epsilon chain mitochondrial [Holotrichia oblita]|uniref:Atp synthase epsilon chain mitochondrial n=2 Tax=Holotrichia oblita TaxID=644536 RepID=A0ACB9TW55_HOLOL|nr:atp synthase epsilon chain mitochondrial [Holotrichia oblita]KAI4471005.1 atp synthase epsilon chain mitochondrial [Holotrichia oblita]